MRLSAALVTAALTLLSAAAPPAARAADATSLDGHWRCTGPNIPPTERSYFTVLPDARTKRTGREIFAGADSTLRSGEPVTTYERIAELPDESLDIQAVEGNGTTPPHATFPLRFTGRTQDGDAAFTLTYELDGVSLHRTATRNGAVVDDERCTREPDPAPTTCPQPNVPAAVLKNAEAEYYPPEAYTQRIKGIVNVRVVLDDRSRVLWADVQSSDNPVFNESARAEARATTFRTETRNCRPIAAVYIFTVQYGP